MCTTCFDDYASAFDKEFRADEEITTKLHNLAQYYLGQGYPVDPHNVRLLMEFLIRERSTTWSVLVETPHRWSSGPTEHLLDDNMEYFTEQSATTYAEMLKHESTPSGTEGYLRIYVAKRIQIN